VKYILKEKTFKRFKKKIIIAQSDFGYRRPNYLLRVTDKTCSVDHYIYMLTWHSLRCGYMCHNMKNVAVNKLQRLLHMCGRLK